MPLTDLRKAHKPLYSASVKKPAIVDVPTLKCLTCDGEGHPNDNPGFQQGFEALYAIAYTLKFTYRLGSSSEDFRVMPPEALWWVDGDKCFGSALPEKWRWRLMIAVPDYVDGAAVRDARSAVKKKKGLTSVDRVRLRKFREGKAVQLLHVGPYDQEPETLARMDAFAAENACRPAGKHHEIYLSDPRRTAPERLKTILRIPVRKARVR